MKNKNSKPARKKQTKIKRRQPKRVEKTSILIVCEGKNTEPSYFRQFRITSVNIKVVGEGYNTISLIDRAVELSKGKDYDQVWCVFDKDDFPDEDFNNAIQKAKAQGIKVAYSNQAFEYWFILHFNDHQGGCMNRSSYNQTINSLIKPFNIKYDGTVSKKVSSDFFDLLMGVDEKTEKERRVDIAIRRAKRNHDRFNNQNCTPAKAESSTTVFCLVEVLLKNCD